MVEKDEPEGDASKQIKPQIAFGRNGWGHEIARLAGLERGISLARRERR